MFLNMQLSAVILSFQVNLKPIMQLYFYSSFILSCCY